MNSHLLAALGVATLCFVPTLRAQDLAKADPASVLASTAPDNAENAKPVVASIPLDVVVTVPPLKSLVEPLLPTGSTLTMLMRPGRSEHGYEFTPDDIARLAKADVVVLVGLGLEPRVEQALQRQRDVSSSELKPQQVVLNWGELVDLKQSEDAAHHDHDHHGGCNHGHGWVDQHLWLDPAMVQRLIPHVQDAVVKAQNRRAHVEGKRLAPEEVERVAKASSEKQLLVSQVDLEYRTALTPFQGRAIVCHHDAYGRLADRYGLKVAAAIKSTTAGEPTPRELADVVKAIREHQAQAVFIEPQFDPAMASRVAKAAGVRIAQLDPLGQGDWALMMRQNLENLTRNLGEASTVPAASNASTRGK